LKQDNKIIEQIINTKQKRRQYLARLPIEKKISLLVQLQKTAAPILASRGLKRTPWNIQKRDEAIVVGENWTSK
jgi:hypothetical protein